MRKTLALGFAALVMLAGAAVAQQYGIISVPILTGSERIVVNNGGATITSVSSAQLRDAGGYLIAAPASGATVQAANNASMLALQPAATLAALTVNLPTAPFDGQRVQIFTSQAVTALTLAAPVGTISAPVMSLTAGQSVEYFYAATSATWNRIQ